MHYHADNLTLDIAGFFNNIGHFIFISPTGEESGNGLPVYRYMQQNSRLYGGEAGIHYHPKSIQWLHIETTYSTVTGKQSNGDYLPFIPAGKINLNLMVKKEKLGMLRNAFISLNVNKAFRQNSPAPDETATDGYTLVDAATGFECSIGRQPFMVKLSGSNLFDVRYIDHLSTLKEVNLYNPGRNISLSLSVPFSIKVAM